jgi:hypothetical protein
MINMDLFIDLKDGMVPCPSCRDTKRLSERDNLFRSYAHLLDAKENCIMCKGKGKILAEPHEVFE